ncbi:hypothetical protein HHK36_024399 [Tetracentron sinense]|uniref:Uncharacterized protein n=1 Tax=Tetracentron sinense TaxID=13715 RepID=A0A835D4L3_TETSI|nr:hypothetical protein HHK36_024399 [Tetracentron sinense]
MGKRMTKKVSIRFTSLVAGLFFILLTVRDSTAHALQAMEMMSKADGNGFAMSTGGNAVSIEKELFDGIPTAAAARNKRLGGRKMAVFRKEMVKEQGLNGGASKISGANHTVEKCNHGEKREELNVDCKLSDRSILPAKVNVKNSNKLKPKTLSSSSIGSTGTEPFDLLNTNQLNSQDSGAISTCGSLGCSPKSKLSVPQESQKLLEAANEIVKLTQKDYTGMNKPGRTPPINNNYPLDEEDLN